MVLRGGLSIRWNRNKVNNNLCRLVRVLVTPCSVCTIHSWQHCSRAQCNRPACNGRSVTAISRQQQSHDCLPQVQTYSLGHYCWAWAYPYFLLILKKPLAKRNVVHVQWMIKICQYESEWSMRCRKFLSESEVGPIESCRLSPGSQRVVLWCLRWWRKKMTQDVVAVVEDAVEQIVIGFTAQVGERRQVWWSKSTTFAATDERLYSLTIGGTCKAPLRRRAVQQLGRCTDTVYLQRSVQFCQIVVCEVYIRTCRMIIILTLFQ